jgi:hypothetical protein
MEYDLIEHIQTLLGNNIKGYVITKPENTPYPAFVVEDSVRRGQDIYNNNGKPFDYEHSIQINLIGQRFSTLTVMKNTIVEALDGFRGTLGTQNVVDCRLVEATSAQNTNKNYEYILFFSLNTQ